MNLKIRSVKSNDLSVVSKLESDAFSMPEEMAKKDMRGRIENYSDTFLVAEVDRKVVGHIFGPASSERYIKDEMYYLNHPNNATDPYQMILSLAVLPEYRKQGIATALVTKLETNARSAGRKALSLTCFPELFSFYKRLGFDNEGITSADIPDPEDESSYNFVKEL